MGAISALPGPVTLYRFWPYATAAVRLCLTGRAGALTWPVWLRPLVAALTAPDPPQPAQQIRACAQTSHGAAATGPEQKNTHRSCPAATGPGQKNTHRNCPAAAGQGYGAQPGPSCLCCREEAAPAGGCARSHATRDASPPGAWPMASHSLSRQTPATSAV